MAPTIENAKFLFLCHKYARGHKIDYAAVGRILNLKTGTANMRMTRLKTALENGKDPSADNMEFLWACLTANNNGQMPAIDWKALGAEMNIKPGTANMRLTRLKASMGKSGSAPNTPSKSRATSGVSTLAKKTPSKQTPSKSRSKSKGVKAEPIAFKEEELVIHESDTDSATEIPDAVKKRLSATPSRAVKRKVIYAESDGSEDYGSGSDTYTPVFKKVKMEETNGDVGSPLARRQRNAPQNSPLKTVNTQKGPLEPDTNLLSNGLVDDDLTDQDAERDSVYGEEFALHWPDVPPPPIPNCDYEEYA